MNRHHVTGALAAGVLALGVLVNAQTPGATPGRGTGQGQPGAPGQGAPSGGGRGRGMGMMAQPNLPTQRTVHITGENPGLQLRAVAGGPILAEVNFWRVTWSPVGVGHACYVMTGDGKGPNDLRLVLTDNEKLANYVTYDTMSKLVGDFAAIPYKVVKATFATEGDTLNERSEICKSDQYTVKATWRRITPGQLGGMQPGNGFAMMFIIQMAAEGEITINGQKQPGTVLAAGPGQRPPSYLAFAETWLK